MRNVAAAALCFASMFAIVPSGLAQDIPTPPPLLETLSIESGPTHLLPAVDTMDKDGARRAAELQAWVESFSKWQEWAALWTGRRQPGWFTRFGDRREKPDPPDWLAERCAFRSDDDSDALLQACRLLVEWREDSATAQVRAARDLARVDKPSKTVWWEHIHMDLMWPAMQWQSSTYAVLGTHTTTTIKGRLQVFLAPGAMMLNLPDRNGSRSWKFATNYGVGWRLFDFTFPGQRPASLHLNLAKAWVVSDVSDVVTGRTMDFAGFSITFNKN